MKITKLLLSTLILFFLTQLSNPLYAQKTIDPIGAIGKKVTLKSDGEKYLFIYQDKNEDADGARSEFVIEDEATLNKLYNLLIDGFESMNPGPIEFELKDSELRLYYIKKMGRNKVEIIHENKETEETGTISRLRKKDVEKLFGKKS
jgi:hypothetical protein